MPGNDQYLETLSAAIDDIIEHGYDSPARIAYWTAKLKDAAERTLKPSADMERMLRDALAATYRRMVEQGGLARLHPGVERWRIEKVRPALRVELDRRILASADLIRLNKQAAVAKTLQRFAGWSTSIPPGGTDAASKREEKDNIRKPLARVKFEERRVLIDQGHKLTASLNNIVAVDGGAIAVIWNSHWRQPGYRFRPDHKERDKQVYGIRNTWAYDKGLAKKPEAGWYDEITAFAQEPYCRCFGTYLFSLRDLEKSAPDALTAKGREALIEARKKIAEMA